MNTPFEITKEEVLELAATKLVDRFADESDMTDEAHRRISERIEEIFAKGIKDRIDAFLDEEMKRIVQTEIVPVNIWGEREGTPTTIRATLAKRAQEFWNVRVDKEGRESSYGGEERSKKLMKEILNDSFAEAVRENADVIVAEFKTSLKANATAFVTDHIEKLIPAPRRR